MNNTDSRIQGLMDTISQFDCDPKVYRVILEKAAYREGFQVNVLFYKNDAALFGVEFYGDDPVMLLEKVLEQLKLKYSRCEACGNYRQGEEYSEAKETFD